MKQEGRPAEQVAKADCEYPIECDINEYKKGDLPQCRSPFYNGRNAIRKEGKDTCLNEQPSGHFVIQRHIREVLIFTVPERGSSRWILSRKELWIKYLQQ